jgi:hypothetical protein
MNFLADFDASNNNLTGEIPKSGQLMTFAASRYDNNSGLCGIPLPPCNNLVDSGGDESQDVTDGQVPLVSPTGLGVGLVFGFLIGFF